DGRSEGDQKRLYERVLPAVIQRLVERAVETGVEKLTEAPENLRELVNDLKIPGEAGQYLYQQMDDTKKGVYRVVAKELRDVLEHTNFADEIADVLTKLSFEINTTIRFVPNPAGLDPDEEDETGGDEDEVDPAEGPKRPASKIPRPKVVSKVAVKARNTPDRRSDD
ncbi:MAG: hypothetical protein JRI68_08410, partial [Deltaproteobacteria bacterium]|nr:hypothetical protein [Deltaproteobacteria bacterium]